MALGHTRRMRLVAPLTMVSASLLVVAACGPVRSDGDSNLEPAPGSRAAGGGPTELTVLVRSGPGTGRSTYSVACDPPRGSHPDPAAACRLLSELVEPFAPVPRGAMCTEIYGGPQTATVTGTLRGEPVNAQFRRTDGCEIARWDEHAVLLVEAGGVGAG